MLGRIAAFWLLAISSAHLAFGQGEQAAIGTALDAKARFESMLTDPIMARLFESSPDLKRLAKQAEAKLVLAQDTMAFARTAWHRREAMEHAIDARRAYENLENRLRRRWERAQTVLAEGEKFKNKQAEIQALKSEVLKLADKARHLLSRPSPSDPQILEARGAVGRALQACLKMPGEADAEALASLRDALLQSTRTLDQLLASPPVPERHQVPERLQRAVAAFLAGDYRRTTELLAVCQLGSPEATRTAYLLRGAAYFSLWVESGEKDQTLYQQALNDVRQCQKLGGTADTTALSPRFLALFR